MNRKYAVALLLFLCLSFAACCINSGENAGDTFSEGDNCSYEVSTDVLEIFSDENHISVKYPSFETDGECCTRINQLIEHALNDYIIASYGKDYSGLTISADYEIMHINNEYASIVIRGTSNVSSAAHPIKFAFAVNIVMESKQYDEKSGMISIDNTLAQQVVDFAKTQSNSAVEVYFEQFTLESIKDLLQRDDVFFYRVDKGLGIIIPVPHSIGDYVEFQIG